MLSSQKLEHVKIHAWELKVENWKGESVYQRTFIYEIVTFATIE